MKLQNMWDLIDEISEFKPFTIMYLYVIRLSNPTSILYNQHHMYVLNATHYTLRKGKCRKKENSYIHMRSVHVYTHYIRYMGRIVCICKWDELTRYKYILYMWTGLCMDGWVLSEIYFHRHWSQIDFGWSANVKWPLFITFLTHQYVSWETKLSSIMKAI